MRMAITTSRGGKWADWVGFGLGPNGSGPKWVRFKMGLNERVQNGLGCKWVGSAGPSYFASSHEGVPDDGMRSCPVDAGISSCVYGGGGQYDYDESGLADRFSNIVHAANQPLWDGCNQFQLGDVAELRLYSLSATAEHMMWHAAHQIVKGSICHPSDAETWKHFDWMYPNFAEEPHNVRLNLCTDDFASHSQYSGTYSCWSVIIKLYNLSPGMCMSSEYMLLTMVIPGSFNPKHLIDVYLEPLIEELLQLWHVGVRMYDHAPDRTLMLLAALMSTVNDLPVYGMASGWSTARVMGYNYFY
ncbi:UNVERIFIED_CONTAM: hypothetical protein Sangu_1729900 [Sesamum angustifolium]|uniref:Uncharacterized protein n=1 Tax=Sesamum angustifolium TaxID=2727405 RepID=A0AAW2M4V5_9LAMI